MPLQHRRVEVSEDRKGHKLRGELIEDLKQVLLRFYPKSDWGQLRGEERSQRRRAIGLLSGLALLFLVLAVTALEFALYAQRQRLVAESRALAAQAEQMIALDQPEALDLAIRGLHTAKTGEAKLAIAHAFPQLLATLEGHTNAVLRAAFSPDGHCIVTASNDHTARVWNAATGQLLETLKHAAVVADAAFSPDGQRIVTASEEHARRIIPTRGDDALAVE